MFQSDKTFQDDTAAQNIQLVLEFNWKNNCTEGRFVGLA